MLNSANTALPCTMFNQLETLRICCDVGGCSALVVQDGLEQLGMTRALDVEFGTRVMQVHFGATACLIGRPAVYGLVSDGQSGVSAVLDILAAEAATALGATSLDQLRLGTISTSSAAIPF